MANALINSGPLLVGMTDPETRRSFSKYVYRVSRTSLLEVSSFDEAGINYRLPDHVHSERSTPW